MNRNFRIALMMSMGIHVFFMSAVVIVNPAPRQKIKPYINVDFLGPLLKKTAFDIMLESANPVVKTNYTHAPLVPASGYLEAPAPERQALAEEFSRYYLLKDPEPLVLNSLAAPKSVPEFLLRFESDLYFLAKEDRGERRLIYKPAPTVFMKGFCGVENAFTIKVRVLISAEGLVKVAEPLTASGHPQLDMIATKYVRSWIFEPKDEAGSDDEWHELNVVLKTENW